jgi:Protein of unknown function (DUF3631)
LLRDIRATFVERDVDRLASADLTTALNDLEESPWGDWPMTARKLAAMLRPFGIGPVAIRLPDGKTPRGYRAEHLRDAWARYLDGSPIGEVQQVQQTQHPTSGATSDVAFVADVADTLKRPPEVG